MIVALGLPLKVFTIIICFIFSMLFSDFRTHGPISIPTSPIVALTEFSMLMQRQMSIHCRYHDILYLRYEIICVLGGILYYDLSQKPSASVVGLFYLKF